MSNRFRFGGKAASALIMTRLQFSQMMEVNQLICEMADNPNQLSELSEEYEKNLVTQVKAMLQLSIEFSDLEPEVIKYCADLSNSAFPNEGSGLSDVDLNTYLTEAAEDIVTLFAIPAPDIVSEIESVVSDISCHLEPFDKN